MTRKDSLKEKNSGPSCEKVRTITKNCKDKEEKDEGKLKRCGILTFTKFNKLQENFCQKMG